MAVTKDLRIHALWVILLGYLNKKFAKFDVAANFSCKIMF